MPVLTIERLKQKEAVLEKRLATAAKGTDSTRRRILGRRLRRVQRRRRRELAEAARREKKSAAPGPAA